MRFFPMPTLARARVLLPIYIYTLYVESSSWRGLNIAFRSARYFFMSCEKTKGQHEMLCRPKGFCSIALVVSIVDLS